MGKVKTHVSLQLGVCLHDPSMSTSFAPYGDQSTTSEAYHYLAFWVLARTAFHKIFPPTFRGKDGGGNQTQKVMKIMLQMYNIHIMCWDSR